MWAVFRKEIGHFLSSLTGYMVVGVFLVLLGGLLFIFPQTNILDYGYAGLDALFSNAPLVFLFLIPAITMRSFAEETQTGTIELLATRPLRDADIILGKYFAALALVVFAIIPTFLYYYTVYQLGNPQGNIDQGATIGSYIGLLFLAGALVSIGVFTSAITQNQIVAFLLSALFCAFALYGFDLLSKLPIFFGKTDDLVEMLGINYHYGSVSRGVIDSRDILYFLSFIILFLLFTQLSILRKKS